MMASIMGDAGILDLNVPVSRMPVPDHGAGFWQGVGNLDIFLIGDDRIFYAVTTHYRAAKIQTKSATGKY